MEQILSITQPLSVLLQTENCDLVTATTDIKAIIAAIELLRQTSESSFPWCKIEQLAKVAEVRLEKPRITGRQTHRSNVNVGDSVADYFRVNVYNAFLDSVIVQLHDRFSRHFDIVKDLSMLIPGKNQSRTFTVDSISHAVNFYGDILNKTQLYSELQSWNARYVACF
jgi:hypothetical protein